MARNAQIWNEDYALILDGPRATPLEIARASATVRGGGRSGYRFYYPPMRAGEREIFWHLPLVARLGTGSTAAETWDGPQLLGYAQAEAPAAYPDRPPIALVPRLLGRPGYLEAAEMVGTEPGRARFVTTHNVQKLLAFRELLGDALPPSFARALVHAAKHESLDAWLDAVAKVGGGGDGKAKPGARCAALLERVVGPDGAGARRRELDAGLTFDGTHTRAFEEKLWKTIAGLAEGEFRMKDTADSVTVNRGKNRRPRRQGRAARAGAAPRSRAPRRSPARALPRAHRGAPDDRPCPGGRSAFRWETDFPFRWSEGWSRNQSHEAHERNIVLMIPGRNRGEAVIMADHYDTAYMEDVYESDRGGDGLRAAAAGADDNHSATTALLLAAETLLPLAREGKLARDVWLVHLTGEEFPSDCLGARALAQALCERRLRFAAESGAIVDVSRVRVTGAYVLDMIAHNSEHDRDVFQIAPGEGVGLGAPGAAGAPGQRALEPPGRRAGTRRPSAAGRSAPRRMEHGAKVPPLFAHLALARRGSTGVGSALGALQHRRADLLGRRDPGGALHGELRHQPDRLPRHRRHDEEHRPRLRGGADRHRHRDGDGHRLRALTGAARGSANGTRPRRRRPGR